MLVVKMNPCHDEVTKMIFCQWDHKVQTLASQRPDEAFTDRIRYGCPHRWLENFQTQMPDTLVESVREHACVFHGKAGSWPIYVMTWGGVPLRALALRSPLLQLD